MLMRFEAASLVAVDGGTPEVLTTGTCWIDPATVVGVSDNHGEGAICRVFMSDDKLSQGTDVRGTADEVAGKINEALVAMSRPVTKQYFEPAIGGGI